MFFEQKSNSKQLSIEKISKFVCILLLVVGICFRFANLDGKIYWYDEAYTSLRVSGYTETEVIQQFATPKIITAQELQLYQQPNQDKNLVDTIESLAKEEPQHSPFYFLLVRFWMQLFGNSIAVTRSLSVVISLLAFPCIYWLCLELFNSSFAAWLSVAVIAISPFHFLYAQEAREYSLWTVTILLCSASFLRALRLKTKWNWLLYALTSALSFYSFALSVLVTISHGIYLLILEKFRFTKSVKAFCLASGLGVLLFIPWLLVVWKNLSQIHQTLSWSNYQPSLIVLLLRWIPNFTRIFIDWNYLSSSPLLSRISIIPSFIFFGLLFAYSLYHLYKKTAKKVWLFVIIFIFLPTLFLTLPDLIKGGQQSIVLRYFTPAILGIELAVVYLLSEKLSLIWISLLAKRWWQLTLVGLFSSGLISCAIASPAEIWWTKLANQATPNLADVINQSHPHSLLIVDAEIGDIFSLSRYLDKDLSLLLEPRCYGCKLDSASSDRPSIPEIANQFEEVLLFKARPSQEWLKAFSDRDRSQTKQIYVDRFNNYLWSLNKD
jgi:uncharacterized membrane protein